MGVGRILLIVYVDNIVIRGDDRAGIVELKLFLQSTFQTRILANWGIFLDIEVARVSLGIYFSRRKYTLNLLSEIGMLGSNTMDAPMDPNSKLVGDQGELLTNPVWYRRLVGKWNNLIVTRLDISFTLSVMSQFLDAPRISH